MVLPGFDQQGYLDDPHAPEEVHRMAFVGNIVEQVEPPQIVIGKNIDEQ
jgi:hypothetical protein